MTRLRRGFGATSTAVLLIAAVMACDAPTAKTHTPGGRRVVVAPRTDTALVQHRADWDVFAKALPADPSAAASAIERYRQRYGLPLDFFVDARLPDSLRRTLGSLNDESQCGATVTAFVRSIPVRHPLLSTSPVIELDSAGRTLREWRLGSDAEYWDPIVGVTGSELVVGLQFAPRGVYMRLQPSGSYRVSAEPPSPLPPEEWIALHESNWVRVRPNDQITAHAATSNAVAAGRPAPRGDSGWYVRVDSGPHFGDSARSIPGPFSRQPHVLPCPRSAAFEGMICRGFPDAGVERRIASPSTCT